MPRAGRRRRSVSAATSPPASTAAAASAAQRSSHGREEIAVSSEPPRQQRRRFLSPASSPTLLRGGLVCKRCGEGGDGGGVVWTSSAGEGSSGGPLGGSSFSAAVSESGDNFDPGRMKKVPPCINRSFGWVIRDAWQAVLTGGAIYLPSLHYCPPFARSHESSTVGFCRFLRRMYSTTFWRRHRWRNVENTEIPYPCKLSKPFASTSMPDTLYFSFFSSRT